MMPEQRHHSDNCVVVEDDDAAFQEESSSRSQNAFTAMKLLAASALFYSAGTSFAQTWQRPILTSRIQPFHGEEPSAASVPTNNAYSFTNHRQLDVVTHGRRLSDISKEAPPSYMEGLMEDLKARKKLMEETPPEEVKYWFEYTGPLQVR